MIDEYDDPRIGHWHVDREPTDLIKWVHCGVCGHVKPHDGWKTECRGPQRLREMEKVETVRFAWVDAVLFHGISAVGRRRFPYVATYDDKPPVVIITEGQAYIRNDDSARSAADGMVVYDWARMIDLDK